MLYTKPVVTFAKQAHAAIASTNKGATTCPDGNINNPDNFSDGAYEIDE